MAVTLTFDPVLSRIRIDANGLAAADYATIEYSTNQVQWTTIRGGAEVAVTAGAFDLPVDFYEFADGVPNYIRVRGVETAAAAYVATTATVFDANAAGTSTLAPALPAGLLAGDVVYIYAQIRNSGTGTVNTPTNWTQVAASGNVALLGRVYDGVWSMPTVTFTGGVANATVGAKAFAFRRVALAALTSNALLNASAQNVAYPAVTVTEDNAVVMAFAWKQDDWTSVAPLAGMTELIDIASTLGDDMALAIDYVIQTTAADIAAGSFTVTGGTSAISRGLVVVAGHAEYLNEQTANITPNLVDGCTDQAVWLKSVARPFLNQAVRVLHRSPAVTRPARTGVFDVVGRTNPVAVNDVRKSRRWTMLVRTDTAAEADLLDLLLASGDVLYVHVPAGCDVSIPGGHVTVGDVTSDWHPLRPLSKTWTLPMVEVAPPGPDVVGATVTWASVIAAYSDWLATGAAHSSWADLLTLIGDPSEVIVP